MDDKNRSFSTDNTDDDDYVDMVLDDGTELIAVSLPSSQSKVSSISHCFRTKS